MHTHKESKPNYRIGPPTELLEQIGQIMVNYSECERAIFEIFKSVMNISEKDGYLLVRITKINTEKMLEIIKQKIESINPKPLIEPLQEGISLFKKSVTLRNMIAHWQWAITDGEAGLAFDSIKAKPEAKGDGRNFKLSELKSVAWVLAKSAMLLGQVSIMIRPSQPLQLSMGGWASNNYSTEIELYEEIIKLNLTRTQEIIHQYEKAHPQEAVAPT